MNTGRLNEIRARYKGLEMIVAGRDVTDLLSEIDRLTKDNAELTERVERAEKRLGEAVDCIEKIDKFNNALGSAVIDDKITAWRGLQGGETK